jgi:putative hydrolase of the HAD superfamily
MIRALAFDGNGVLYYREKDHTDALVEYLVQRYLPDCDRAAVTDLFRSLMVQAFDASITKPEALERFYAGLGIVDPEVKMDLTRVELECSRRIHLFPGEKETLPVLARRGFKLGMITNSFQSAAEKASWFRALGLDCVVETVVSSVDAGFSKPDPRIYLEFARRVGLPVSEIAFVGHEAFELQGARAAGMTPVSFNCAPEVEEALHLRSFADLLELFPPPA